MKAGPRTIAVTGAAGSLAQDIMPGLLARGYRLRCLDKAPPPELTASKHQSWHQLDLCDAPGLKQVLRGVDAVIHLGGIPLEDDWDSLSRNNIDATQTLLQSAVEEAVPRVILASSIHAAGGHPLPVDPRELAATSSRLPEEQRVSASVSPQPTTLYGVSKAAVEALGHYYASQQPIQIVCIRIASRFAEPSDERMLSTWLSPADAERMFAAAITSDLASSFTCLWGVSDNQRGYLSLKEGQEMGFHPKDDAEKYAATVLQEAPKARATWDFTLGGVFSSPHPPRMPKTATTESARG